MISVTTDDKYKMTIKCEVPGGWQAGVTEEFLSALAAVEPDLSGYASPFVIETNGSINVIAKIVYAIRRNQRYPFTYVVNGGTPEYGYGMMNYASSAKRKAGN
jgi:hypothetical protein